jgi:DNA-binding SARP family transcriptional activator
MVQLTLFGFPNAFSDGQSVKLSNKAFALLAYLALEGRTSRRKLGALFWSGTQDALNNLSVVRGEIVAALGAEALIADSFSLALGAVQSDVLEWQSSLDAQRRWVLCEKEFLQGLRFRDWHIGLGGEFEEWLESQRRRFGSERCRLAFELARQTLELGSLRPALRWLEAAALDRFEPSEEAARLWLLTLGALGESALCKKAADSFTTVLLEAFGVSPVAATQSALELALSGNSPACLSILQHEFSGKVEHRVNHQVRGLLKPELPLFGRECEWVQMEAAWQAGKAIFISGDLGIGKSRLALEFVQSKGAFWQVSGKPGDSFVPYSSHARCFEQLRKDYPNLRLPDWVRSEMARIVPAYGDAPAPINNDQDKLRFFDAQAEVYRLAALENRQATLLFDNLQLVDTASSEAGVYLHSKFLPYKPDFPHAVFVFQTNRLKPEIESGVRDWVQLGLAEWIELQPLSKKAVQQCLNNIDVQLEPLLNEIMRFTGGNPLFVLETAHALLKQDLRIHQLQRSSIPRAYEIIQLRLEQLPEEALLLARFAAITGEQFSGRLAQVALEWTWQQVTATVEILEKAKIITGTHFTHDLILQAILEGTSELLQSTLHLQALRTLEVIGAPAEVLVVHALGANQIEAARQYSLQASAVFALEDTKTH